MKDTRNLSQRWADSVTEFSGSWTFIFAFACVSAVWIVMNLFQPTTFDPYPFLFLNWMLTVVSTFQNPLILLSQNRQNEMDRVRLGDIIERLERIERHIVGNNENK